MVLYSIIVFLAAIPTLILSIGIYRGKTSLIHDYHQTNVTDPAAYGKAFGKAMLAICASMILSGIIGLFGDCEAVAMVAIAIVLIGLIAGIVWIVIVQKKYNKGVF